MDLETNTFELTRAPDDVDRAAEIERLSTEMAIKRALETATPALPAVGSCYNCDEPLGPTLRFCDEFCCEDYDHRMQRRKVNAR
ncbi:hypothetical protein D9M69_454230 [compost metagenome]